MSTGERGVNFGATVADRRNIKCPEQPVRTNLALTVGAQSHDTVKSQPHPVFGHLGPMKCSTMVRSCVK